MGGAGRSGAKAREGVQRQKIFGLTPSPQTSNTFRLCSWVHVLLGLTHPPLLLRPPLSRPETKIQEAIPCPVIFLQIPMGSHFLLLAQVIFLPSPSFPCQPSCRTELGENLRRGGQ